MKLSFIIPMYFDSFKGEYHKPLMFWNTVGTEHEVIIVDDGSPDEGHFKWLSNIYSNINFERIEENIPWNQPAARNLGAAAASGDILVFTDFDHIFRVYNNSDFDVITKTFEEGTNGKTYLFPRIKDGETIGSHPCSFAILRDDFKGFDESFCGSYGYDDNEFMKRHKPVGILPICTEVALHESTHDLLRDPSENIKKL